MGLFGKKEVVSVAVVVSDEAIQGSKKHLENAAIYEAGGLWDKAIREYNEAIQLNQNDINTYIKIAQVYQKQGLFDDADMELLRASKVDPKNADIHVQRGINFAIKYKLTRSGLDEGGVWNRFNDAIRTDPSNISARILLGEFYEYTARWDKAIKEYNEAMRIKPDDPLLKLKLAAVQNKKESCQTAFAELWCEPQPGYGHRILVFSPKYLFVLNVGWSTTATNLGAFIGMATGGVVGAMIGTWAGSQADSANERALNSFYYIHEGNLRGSLAMHDHYEIPISEIKQIQLHNGYNSYREYSVIKATIHTNQQTIQLDNICSNSGPFKNDSHRKELLKINDFGERLKMQLPNIPIEINK